MDCGTVEWGNQRGADAFKACRRPTLKSLRRVRAHGEAAHPQYLLLRLTPVEHYAHLRRGRGAEELDEPG